MEVKCFANERCSDYPKECGKCGRNQNLKRSLFTPITKQKEGKSEKV